MNFSTARLHARELSIEAIESQHTLRLCDRIPSILTEPVVANLPPYFHGITTAERSASWLKKMVTESRLWVVYDVHDDLPVGFVFASLNEGVAHIGYLLSQSSWGYGLASELLAEFIVQAKTVDGWDGLLGGVDRNNLASAHLLQKLGFEALASHDDEQVVFYHCSLCPTHVKK